MSIIITRTAITCEECDSTNFELYPDTGHRCDWSRYGTEPQCEREAKVALIFGDGDPMVPFFCEEHAAEEERYNDVGYPPDVPKTPSGKDPHG
jgi:hypothetical protein